MQHTISMTPIHVERMPRILNGFTANTTALRKKMARLKNTSAAVQYRSDFCMFEFSFVEALFVVIVIPCEQGYLYLLHLSITCEKES